MGRLILPTRLRTHYPMSPSQVVLHIDFNQDLGIFLNCWGRVDDFLDWGISSNSK